MFRGAGLLAWLNCVLSGYQFGLQCTTNRDVSTSRHRPSNAPGSFSIAAGGYFALAFAIRIRLCLTNPREPRRAEGA